MQNRKTSGFSLIELLTVVAIIGVIAAIGVPSYTQYLLKAGRAEASATLLEVMASQEEEYRRERSYTVDLTDLGFDAAIDTPSERHRITASACPGQNGTRYRCILLTATAQNKSAGDVNLTLDSKGTKATVDSGGALGEWD